MEKKDRNSERNYSAVRRGTSSAPLLEYGKIPPQAIEIEEAVLGALMIEASALNAVVEILKPNVFYKDAHRYIMEAISDLFIRGEPVDLLTVTNELKARGTLEAAGGPFYITQLTSRIASSANIEFHSRIIIEKFIQRELIRISTDTVRDAFEDVTDVFELLDKAEQNLFNIAEQNLRRQYSSTAEIVKDAIRNIEAAMKNRDKVVGVETGFSELDRITGGWQKSDLIIVASRPGMGKTSFVLSMARNITVEFKKAVAFFSLEMSSVQLVTRLISSEALVYADKLRRGDINDYEWQKVSSVINVFEQAKLFIDDTPALSVFELRAKARRLKLKHDIQAVFIDYLQLMTVGSDGDRMRGNREQEISNISRSLKALAKELNIPVIALSQLSRAVETRGGSKKPILSDLRESGAIEQDADLVIFIYRPEYYKLDTDEQGNSTQGIAEIDIAKHRNGALGTVQLRFISSFAKFVDPVSWGADFTPVERQTEETEKSTSFTMPSRMNTDPDDGNVPF